MRSDALTRLQTLEVKLNADKPNMVALVYGDGHHEEVPLHEALGRIAGLTEDNVSDNGNAVVSRMLVDHDHEIVEVIGSSLLNAMCPHNVVYPHNDRLIEYGEENI